MTEDEIREGFFRSRDASAMLEARSALVDEVVRERWLSGWPSGVPQGIALAAVGGYGRRELFPYSDIDLMILTADRKAQSAVEEPLALFLRDLWDKGLRISQAVHTPAECNQIDRTNAELAVSLLDRRFLAGDAQLFGQVRDPRAELGRNIAQLTRDRHAHYQNTIYHLEPNVKDSPGGLRDLQVLRWLAQLGVADESGAQGMSAPGMNTLFGIRCFLHYLAGRDDNKLSFDRQDEIAELSGEASPEDLMRHYYRAVRGINRLASRRLDRFEARGESLVAQVRERASKLSNTEFSVLHGCVFFRHAGALDADSGMVPRLFEFVARHGLPLAPDTEERIERNAPAFETWIEGHQPLWPAFREILRMPHATVALRAMHACGALESLFPELREMESLVIRDFYHRYTVDEHTLVAIRTVCDLRDGTGDLFGDLAAETDEPELLIAALLFHDVGKGTPDQSHVEASRRIAAKALRRVGIDERSLDVVAFLIGSHLEMSAALNGRDLSEPATIREMAAKVGTVERLKLLTLLTFGDISAVHPAAMTPWRRQLLWHLYTRTYAELTRELTSRMPPPYIAARPELRQFIEGLPPRYLRTHNAAEMEEHLRLERESRAAGVAVSLVRSAAWTMNVVADDRPFLFARAAAALSSFGFNILKAEAFSNARGKAIDTFVFSDPLRNLELNPGEGREVEQTVIRSVRGEITPAELLRKRPKFRPDRHALAAARVSFDNKASPSATLVELITQDRPGLLYDVASLISTRGGNIEVVLVDTEAKKAIDVFYVTRDGAKLSDEEARDMVASLSIAIRPE